MRKLVAALGMLVLENLGVSFGPPPTPQTGTLNYSVSCSGINGCIQTPYMLTGTDSTAMYTVACGVNMTSTGYTYLFTIIQTTDSGTSVGITGCGNVPSGGGNTMSGSMTLDFADGSMSSRPATVPEPPGGGCNVTITSIGPDSMDNTKFDFAGTISCANVPDNLMPAKLRNITGIVGTTASASAGEFNFVSCLASTQTCN